jgi:esterase/lipase superfamily enzyme
MELLWYGNWGRPMLIFPTSLGTCSQNEDCGLFRQGLAGKVDGGDVQICSVDAIDGEIWYNQGAHPAGGCSGTSSGSATCWTRCSP